MGNEICCMRKNSELLLSNKPCSINRDFSSLTDLDDKIIKIIKIQSAIRGYLAKSKFNYFFIATSEEISKELDKKKLINKSIILECESYIIYNKLISEKKILPFLEQIKKNEELYLMYENISKFSFLIQDYIVSSPTEVYKGYWNSNKKYHGYGVKFEFDEKKTKNKRTEGIYFNGLLIAQGLIIYSNGEIITGNFNRGKLEGNGEHFRKDGSMYKGGFKNGKYDGLGKEFFEDGTKFEGFFEDGQKKYGTYEWKNGSKYQGAFLNGLFHGKGKYVWPNKKTYDGFWINGKMNGEGKFIYPNGDFYEGKFVDGKKSGFGKYKWGNDKYYEGNWDNDKQNGYGIFYDKNKAIKGIWVDGKIRNRNGESIKKNKTYISDNKNNKDFFDKKGITDEYFYKRYNLSDKKKDNKSVNDLNFNPTFFDKEIKDNFISHLNLDVSKNNSNSMGSIEKINSKINK